ncbi:MAG TPA: hypothetical protein PLH84_05430 [Candidatus Krumholzibacteria bacterium]|nr:hypothetical protein [Candidatus Krumholzibacteria bacterium]
MRRWLRDLTLFGILALAAAEVLLRTAVPACMTPETAQDTEFRVLLFDTTAARTGVYTNGRLARDRVRWRINDLGWNSPIDDAGPAQPGRARVAVLGDSYVEGLYVDVDRGLAPRTDAALGDRAQVMGLGKSGLNLAQCVNVAAYARARLAPDVTVVLLTSGGLRRSLEPIVSRPFNRQYTPQSDTFAVRQPRVYGAAGQRTLRKVLRLSALARYLRLNVGLRLGPGAIVQATREDAVADEQEQRLLRRLALRIVTDLRTAVGDGELLVVCDADRRALDGASAPPPPLPEGAIVREACSDAGVRYLDLSDAFWKASEQGQAPFQSKDNYHWNDRGLAVASSALASAVAALLNESDHRASPAAGAAR